VKSPRFRQVKRRETLKSVRFRRVKIAHERVRHRSPSLITARAALTRGRAGTGRRAEYFANGHDSANSVISVWRLSCHRPFTPAFRRTLVQAVLNDAQIPAEKCCFKALRHSCGTQMLDRGRDIREVQDHLGHVSISNTVIYAQITNTHRARVADELRDWR
jgi:integrase